MRSQPADMLIAPRLGPAFLRRPITPRYALLINPFYPKDPRASFGKHVLTPTLALTSIAGATPVHWGVHYWDENLLQGTPPCNPLPQVVGITVHLTFAKRAYELAAWYRAQGSLVILGGLHVLSCPDEALLHADAIAIGDGVQIWPRILGDVESHCLQTRYEADFSRPYALDPAARRSILPRASFLTTTSVIATRGCHNRCGFCYLSTEGLHMPYRMRKVEQVVAEIAADNQPYAVFVDNNLGSRPGYLRELCKALQRLKIIWSAAVTIDITDDASLVRDMALAGCTGVFVGFESLNEGNLSDSRKRTPAPQDYARRVAILHRYGIQVNGSFVLGFDHDRPDVFERTVEWIETNRLECATFHILTPYPGTPLFRRLESEDRILHRDWDKFDTAHVVFKPKHMSCEELERGYAWCYEKLFSHRSIWKRRPTDRDAILAYLAMSYLYKRSNRFWRLLIKHRLTGAVWKPLIEHSRRRHLMLRTRLEQGSARASQCVSAGV
ncbi:MAG TPA: radical SAM protein [Steroidobacteraceae bacterium]|nr:radical SAM protein [Steroidobacteraceae bacterium]